MAFHNFGAKANSAIAKHSTDLFIHTIWVIADIQHIQSNAAYVPSRSQQIPVCICITIGCERTPISFASLPPLKNGFLLGLTWFLVIEINLSVLNYGNSKDVQRLMF